MLKFFGKKSYFTSNSNVVITKQVDITKIIVATNAMAATSLLLFLVFCAGGTKAQNGAAVEVTRNRDGDEYFTHNGTYRNCEKQTCPRSTPTLGSGGACQSDISLRNQCKLRESKEEDGICCRESKFLGVSKSSLRNFRQEHSDVYSSSLSEADMY